MATPIFQPVPSVMFVGTDASLGDALAQATYLSVLRVKHAAAAIERMVVTRPLVVVADEGISPADAAALVQCANDISAEVPHASSELRAQLAEQIRTAALTAERRRRGPAGG
jgi:hypothetical protein